MRTCHAPMHTYLYIFNFVEPELCTGRESDIESNGDKLPSPGVTRFQAHESEDPILQQTEHPLISGLWSHLTPMPDLDLPWLFLSPLSNQGVLVNQLASRLSAHKPTDCRGSS